MGRPKKHSGDVERINLFVPANTYAAIMINAKQEGKTVPDLVRETLEQVFAGVNVVPIVEGEPIQIRTQFNPDARTYPVHRCTKCNKIIIDGMCECTNPELYKVPAKPISGESMSTIVPRILPARKPGRPSKRNITREEYMRVYDAWKANPIGPTPIYIEQLPGGGVRETVGPLVSDFSPENPARAAAKKILDDALGFGATGEKVTDGDFIE